MGGGCYLELREELVLREMRREVGGGRVDDPMKVLCERFGRGPQSPSEEPSSRSSFQSGGDLSVGGGCEPGCSS